MHFDCSQCKQSLRLFQDLKQKGIVSLLLIILILLVVIAVGIFLFSQRQVSVAEFLPKVPVIKTISNATKPVTNSTYSSLSLGFELQYPVKSFSIKEDNEAEFNKRGTGVDNKSVNGDFRKNFKGYVGYEPGQVLGAVVVLGTDEQYETNIFSVWVFNNDNLNLTIEQWFQNYWYYPFVWGVFDYTSKGHIALDTEATISGTPAKYKIISYQPGSPKFLYVSNNNKMYLFRIIGEAGDQILSTFKFTN